MKIIGSFLIIFVSLASSYYYEKHQKEKQRELHSICEFLEFIKSHITHFSAPLDKIFDSYQDKNHYIVALLSHEQLKCISESLNAVFLKCFNSLGKGYKDEQIKLLDFTINEALKELSDLEKDYKQKTRVFRSMAIFIGCSIVILLV